jgi:pimeloyl-ACP methyl ester carboxylesterase
MEDLKKRMAMKMIDRLAWQQVLTISLFALVQAAISAFSPLAHATERVNSKAVEAPLGAPLIFIPGEVSDQRFWSAQRDAFGPRFQVLMYNPRQSVATKTLSSAAKLTQVKIANEPPSVSSERSLISQIASTTTGRAHVVAHGAGGDLALRVALRHPELFRSLTLVEPSVFEMASTTAAGREGLVERQAILNEVKNRLRHNDRKGALLTYLSLWPKLPDALPVWYFSMAQAHLSALADLSVDPAMTDPLTCERVATLQVPLFLLTGAWTSVLHRSINDQLAQCIRHSRQVLLAGGHLMNIREPELFNRTLGILLKEQLGSAVGTM